MPTNSAYRYASSRHIIGFVFLTVAVLVLVPLCMVFGAIDIPYSEVVKALTGQPTSVPGWGVIVVELRLPMTIAALLTGAALSVAGLMLQTTFSNPLAGPSILGVSSGASLGVALVLLGLGGAVGSLAHYLGAIIGAIVGAMAVILLLLMFSSMVRSTAMLLIVGIMVGYLSASVISLLNFFATREGVHGFMVWGLGSFTGLSLERVAVMAAVTVPVIGVSMLMIKPLNALLLGYRYARSLGFDIKVVRNQLLILSGVLTAVVTAFCGPIGFIGLVVPHITRMIMGTSNHNVLLPATALCGSAVALLCALLSVMPAMGGVIPINAITPVIGVPVIIYIILGGRRRSQFT